MDYVTISEGSVPLVLFEVDITDDRGVVARRVQAHALVRALFALALQHGIYKGLVGAAGADVSYVPAPRPPGASS